MTHSLTSLFSFKSCESVVLYIVFLKMCRKLLRFCKNQLDRADLEVYLGRLTGRTYSLSFRR